MRFEPRGRIARERPGVVIGPVELRGAYPVIVVRVKAGSNRQTFRFGQWCQERGVATMPVEMGAFRTGAYNPDGSDVYEDRPTAYECSHPSADVLRELTLERFVVDWHHVLGVGAPGGPAMGTGEHRPRYRSQAQNDKWRDPRQGPSY